MSVDEQIEAIVAEAVRALRLEGECETFAAGVGRHVGREVYRRLADEILTLRTSVQELRADAQRAATSGGTDNGGLGSCTD